MKEQEKIKALESELENEENDLKALGIYKKIQREKRMLRFKNLVNDLKERNFTFKYVSKQEKYIFETKEGIVHFYPKSNKLLIAKDNKWSGNGLSKLRKILDL